jgi:bacteriorhodopsin
MNKDLVVNTFYITYVFLITTGTITFIEAMRTKDIKVRNILNLETCISVVAAFFYGKFVNEVQDNVAYDKINTMRYLDWAITTPIMLLVLVLALLYNDKKGAMKFTSYLVILFFNYLMLGVGYLGEQGFMDKLSANMIGFAGFFGLYGFIYKKYIENSKNIDNRILFNAFVVLWSLYGVFYMLDDETRVVGYNILDLVSKCFVGIFFWAYYTGAFTY